MSALETFEMQTWDSKISSSMQSKAVQALEGGKIPYFPALSFSLTEDERRFLSPEILDPKTKNISYDLRRDRLNGALCSEGDMLKLKEMMRRYALTSKHFLKKLIPHYTSTLIQAKTSFRPVEIAGRKSSYRKDDTRLHVDSFPSNPTQGLRILRIFTNINLEGKPRVWRVGEPFANVVQKMGPKVSHPVLGMAHFLKLLKVTKSLRTPYDHYMLQIHDRMKGDNHYQKTVDQEEIHFPAGSSWMVFTDQVSHAAMSGQHVLEQTFHLPVKGIKNESTTPLRVLEKFLNKSLV